MRCRLLFLILLATGLVALGPAPGHAAVRTLTTSYTCDSPYGGGASSVRVRADLPRRVRAGQQVDARRIAFRIVVPEALVDTMRTFGIDEVSATSDGAKYRVGTKRIPIRNLRIPSTAVPPSGEDMVLRGSGRAAAFTLRAPGRYPVKVPATFTADALADGSIGVELDCALDAGAPARLATLRVVR